ncbi:ATP-binding cassette domain-containing protein [Calycomorphotria hydatis]|nr:ATP-binding cassette domain-containing protein [Calycomorphotria hydatis]
MSEPRLKDCSLTISTGRTAVVGASGSGKTSLLNLLVGFEKPDRGKITSTKPAANNSLHWVPPDDGLWTHVSVLEHLTLVHPQGNAGREACRELLKQFDLLELEAVRPHRLSRGERSRLAVARAIASESEILVMDEPLSHVDSARVDRYWSVLDEYLNEGNRSIVLATHEPSRVLRHCESVIGLSDGMICFEGAVNDLYRNPPDEQRAWLLGAANWFDADDAAVWFVHAEDVPHCVRPEQIQLVAENESRFEVESTQSTGSVAITELCDTQSKRRRRCYHLSVGERLEKGLRVSLKLLALVMLCLGAAGCETAEHPQLEVSQERHIILPPVGAAIPAPRAITIGHDDERYVLDNAGRVLVYDAAGELLKQWSMPASENGNPEGICVLQDGSIVVADTHYYQLVFFDSNGEVLRTLGKNGEEPGQFIYPVAITTDDHGNLYVGEYGGNDRLQKFSADGEFLWEAGQPGTGEGEFQRPSGIIWRDGKLYVADAFNSRIQVFSDDGDYLGTLDSPDGHELRYPYELRNGPDNLIYVIEYAAGRVSLLDIDGGTQAVYGSSGYKSGQFKTPWGLAVDSRGVIWVADTGNHRIVELVR